MDCAIFVRVAAAVAGIACRNEIMEIVRLSVEMDIPFSRMRIAMMGIVMTEMAVRVLARFNRTLRVWVSPVPAT